MDGYTATRALRRNPAWQRLPVIAMTASALAEDRDRALASGMNAHLTKPIQVEVMLRTLADWIDRAPAASSTADGAAASGGAASDDATEVIDVRAGMAICMGNEELFHRMLGGFRDTEGGFADEIHQALTERRWADALRRAHDMKGLAGTLGAQRLQPATRVLYTAISMQRADPDGVELALVRTELQRVLAEITTLVSARSG
jgi:CheY-like chemotaxis protein